MKLNLGNISLSQQVLKTEWHCSHIALEIPLALLTQADLNLALLRTQRNFLNMANSANVTYGENFVIEKIIIYTRHIPKSGLIPKASKIRVKQVDAQVVPYIYHLSSKPVRPINCIMSCGRDEV